MAVETLSPDWEFDRVDDGSQSKRAAGQGLRGDAAARASALAVLLREGSASRLLRSPLIRGSFCPLGCEREALSSVTFRVTVHWRGGSGLGMGMGGGDCPGEPAWPWGNGVHLLQSGVTGGAGPGRPCSPGSGVWPWVPGAFARSFQRSLLEEAEVRVPVSVSCFSCFPPQINFFGSSTVFSLHAYNHRLERRTTLPVVKINT